MINAGSAIGDVFLGVPDNAELRARTSGGGSRAEARGIILGRRPKLTTRQKREALDRRTAGEATRDIARTYNVSHSTISRLV